MKTQWKKQLNTGVKEMQQLNADGANYRHIRPNPLIYRKDMIIIYQL